MSQRVSRLASRLHRTLAWLAVVALAVWVLSGLTHPLMSLLGPTAQQFRPPVQQVSGSTLAQSLPALADAAGQARLIKLAPGPDGMRWQLTDGPDTERRYVDIDGSQPADGDRAQAEWLARHFTGLQAPLLETTLQTDFDRAYPWVNRLLPVWRVAFDTPQSHVAYIHTETGALVGYADDRRRLLQDVFRHGHSMELLRGVEPLRLLLVGTLVGALLINVLAGLVLWVVRSRRPGMPRVRAWHRGLALLVGLPVLLMAGSGLFHLVVTRGAPLPPPMALPGVQFPDGAPMAALESPAMPDHVSAAWLRRGVDGAAWLWLRPAVDQHAAAHGGGAHAHHGAGPAAAPPPAVVIDLATGMPVEDGEQQLLALSLSEHSIDAAQMQWPIRGFDPDYDFRNRRLPVVGVLDAGTGDRLAVDPVSGVLVDRSPADRRTEAWVFSAVHKWNPVTGLLGRGGRDLLQAALLALALASAGLGLALHLRRAPASARTGRNRTTPKPTDPERISR